MNHKDLASRLREIAEHVSAVVAEHPEIAGDVEDLVIAVIRAKGAKTTTGQK